MEASISIGACGIACGVCGLFINEVCAGCAAGTDPSASTKLDALRERFDLTCPVLQCAISRKVAYCMKDCDKFPCDVLYQGFPYSKKFLDWFKED